MSEIHKKADHDALSFISEEIGDARSRLNELKRLIEQATTLVDRSAEKDHFYEVAGNLIQEIPEKLSALEKAIGSASTAVAKWVYEDTVDTLGEEKKNKLEKAFDESRIKQVSPPQGSSMKLSNTKQLIEKLAKQSDDGNLSTKDFLNVISTLETKKAGEENLSGALRAISASLEGDSIPSPSTISIALKSVLASHFMKEADSDWNDADSLASEYVVEPEVLYESIYDHALMAKRKGQNGNHALAIVELARIMGDISSLFNSIGDSSSATKAYQMEQLLFRSRPHFNAVFKEAAEAKEADLDDKGAADIKLPHTKAKSLVPKRVKNAEADDKVAKFSEGEDADPTKNMSEEDAEKWKANTDKYEDKFKKARFEEGKPADPTKDMSEEDAKKWKENTDKYEDKFKKAAEPKTASSDPWKV